MIAKASARTLHANAEKGAVRGYRVCAGAPVRRRHAHGQYLSGGGDENSAVYFCSTS
jgi:hypothetical protein